MTISPPGLNAPWLVIKLLLHDVMKCLRHINIPPLSRISQDYKIRDLAVATNGIIDKSSSSTEIGSEYSYTMKSLLWSFGDQETYTFLKRKKFLNFLIKIPQLLLSNEWLARFLFVEVVYGQGVISCIILYGSRGTKGHGGSIHVDIKKSCYHIH